MSGLVWPHPRERLFDLGAAALSDAELVAILLNGGRDAGSVLTTADELLRSRGGLRALAQCSAGELVAHRRVGPASAGRILSAFEIGRRFGNEPLRRGRPIRSSADVYEAFRLRLRDLNRETFWTLLLDGQHRLHRRICVSVGTLTSSLVHPREVFRPAVREGAAAVIALHNHPSGDPTPSRMDWEVTRRLIHAGELLGIPLLDHVITGEEGYVSLKEESTLFD